MRITIDTHAATPAEMGICIATLVACGASVPQLAAISAEQAVRSAVDPDFEKWYDDAMRASNEAGYVGLTAAETIKMLTAELAEAKRATIKNGTLYNEIPTAELMRCVDEMNAELYSRRIPAADNPESGADAAALNSDASGFTKEEIEAAFGGNASGVNLSEVFGGGAKTETVDLRVDKQTSDAVNANPQGAVDALAKGAEQMLGVVLDKAGISWDSRIHSASKSINQTDGLWRQKRGVSPELVATVVGQLKQAQSVPGVAREEQPDGAVTDVDPTDKGVEVVKKVPPPPPRIDVTNLHSNGQETVTGAPPPPPADTGEIDSLPRLLKFITEQKLAGKINQAQVQAALTALGIEGPLPVLQSRPDLIPEMVKKLRAIGGL